MKRRINVLVAALLVVGLFASFAGWQTTAAARDSAPDRYIVVFEDTVDNPAAKAQGLARAHGLTLHHTYRHAIKGFAATIPAARLARIQADPDVAYVNQDRPVSIVAQTLPTGIDRIDGELSSTVSGDGSGSVDVNVAVIDTGIDLAHPDLNVVGGVNCSVGRSYDDGQGHGTHVAGTIAALDDGNGVVGVAPGANLWAVRVLNNAGSGSWSDVICGVDWVTGTRTDNNSSNDIQVANMSLGGSGSDPADGVEGDCNTGDSLHDAICNSVAAGVTYAVAAGNDYEDAANSVPAAYDEVITVSALADFDGKSGGLGSSTCRSDEDDTFANFSNFGHDVDIIAPGVCILSTWKGSDYNTISGTSMATPHVAGAAVLYKASNPGASPDQVKNALLSNGTTDWDNSDDGDNTKEPLLNVSSF